MCIPSISPAFSKSVYAVSLKLASSQVLLTVPILRMRPVVKASTIALLATCAATNSDGRENCNCTRSTLKIGSDSSAAPSPGTYALGLSNSILLWLVSFAAGHMLLRSLQHCPQHGVAAVQAGESRKQEIETTLSLCTLRKHIGTSLSSTMHTAAKPNLLSRLVAMISRADLLAARL